MNRGEGENSVKNVCQIIIAAPALPLMRVMYFVTHKPRATMLARVIIMENVFVMRMLWESIVINVKRGFHHPGTKN